MWWSRQSQQGVEARHDPVPGTFLVVAEPNAVCARCRASLRVGQAAYHDGTRLLHLSAVLCGERVSPSMVDA